MKLFHHKRQQAFGKVGYNPHHIPHQGKYAKIKAKKPRLKEWDEPKYDWPPRLTRPTMHKGKTLLNHLDAEERKK